MSRFNVCARKVLTTYAERPSSAFIDFHWCVESQSRLTGEPFTSLFERISQQHGFGREPSAWPDAAQLRAAAQTLVDERKEYLAQYREMVRQRRAQKRAGVPRQGQELLDQWERKRLAHNKAAPRLGYWGWKAIRDGDRVDASS